MKEMACTKTEMRIYMKMMKVRSNYRMRRTRRKKKRTLNKKGLNRNQEEIRSIVGANRCGGRTTISSGESP